MVVKVTKPHIDEADYALDISSGGTSSMSVPSAQQKLGYVKASSLGVSGGVAKSNNSGKLNNALISGDIDLEVVNSIGPSNIAYGGANSTFIITNYDSFSSYEVSTTNGTVSISEDTIVYTPVNENGVGGFTVNGELFSIQVLEKRPVTPTITSPVDGSTNIKNTVVITANDFAMSSGSDTHVASDWQISTTPTFTSVLYESINDTTNKTIWVSGTLAPSSSYYIRVRYKGATTGYSQWSSAVGVTTKISFIPMEEQQKITASDAAADDYFGWSVSLSGDGSTALVGAYTKSSQTGAAYIFTRSGSTWTQQQKLTASDAATDDRFGVSVSLSGDGSTALVGAYAKSSSTGAAYIFTKSGSTWTQQSKLTASDAATGDTFGRSVSLSSDGSTALVGAHQKSSNAGAAYVFTRSGSTWTQQAKLTASDAAGSDYFGGSVSLSGDGSTALVGAYYKSSATGAAYIFTKSGSTWSQQSKLTASDGASPDRFGISVSLSADGSTALVGAYTKSSYTGAAYIFTRSGSTWTQQQKITASDAATSDYFGYSVSLSADGSTALVGAYYKSSNTGAAYIFTKSGSTWSQQSKLTASDGASPDRFGISVSLSGDGSTALVGAYGEDPGNISNAGSSYFFE